jgi:hypothetical protein
MPREATGRFSVSLVADERNTALGVGDTIAHATHAIAQAVDFASGTADGQIDRVYSTGGTASTTPTDIDVQGAIASLIGAGTVVLADVVGVVIRNTGATRLRVGGDANALAMFNLAASFLFVEPGGFFATYMGPAGLASVAGTGDILQIDTASGTTTYQLEIVGRSA